jgi:carbonic anhydrase
MAWSQGRAQFAAFLITLVAIVLSDLLVGITIGLAVGFFFILREHLRLPALRVISHPGAVLTRYALPEQATFLNKANIERRSKRCLLGAGSKSTDARPSASTPTCWNSSTSLPRRRDCATLTTVLWDSSSADHPDPYTLIHAELFRTLQGDRAWATEAVAKDSGYFERHTRGQQPHFFFLGCCDSRVPTEILTGAEPGVIFNHRNIANQAHPTDMSMLAALEYAVEVLDVRHVLVCGHYNCGGVKAAMSAPGHMLVDNWLQIVRDVQLRHQGELESLPEHARFKRLVELNVLEQVFPALADSHRSQLLAQGPPADPSRRRVRSE